MKTTINKKFTFFLISWLCIYIVSIGLTYFIVNDLMNLNEEQNVTSNIVDLTGELKLDINRLLIPINNYVITGKIEFRDQFDGLIKKTSEIFKNLEIYKRDEEWNLIAKKVKQDVVLFGAKSVDILYIEHPGENEKIPELIKDLNKQSDLLIKEVNKFHKISQKNIKILNFKVTERKKTVYIFLAFISGMVLFSLFPISRYIKKIISDPIVAVHNGAKIIGSGNLNYRLNIKTGDEIEELAEEFNNMTSSLEISKKELERKVLELLALYNISKVLSTSLDTEYLLKEVSDNLSNNLNIGKVMVMTLAKETNALNVSSSSGFNELDLTNMKFKIGEGFFGEIAQSGKTKFIKELQNEENIFSKEIQSSNINSIIVVPFGLRGETLGLLSLFKNKPAVFEDKDVNLFKLIADHIALALENVNLYEKTKMLAITDGLTGIYNYRFLIEKLTEEITRAKRYNRPLSVILLDIDHFKHYNDTHGHLGGDIILKNLTYLIKNNIRTTDVLARYGGEEFLIICPETDKQTAINMAQRIRIIIANHDFPLKETQPEGNLTISLGVASHPDDASEINEIIKKADNALYKAKHAGRNKVEAA